MFVDLIKRAAVILACLTFAASQVEAAELYWSMWRSGKHQEQPWQKMPLIDRVEMLTKEGIYLSMEGTLAPGDFDQLSKIHSLVPIHTLKISSPGGSVAEALKVAEFVDENYIEVETDSLCNERGLNQPFCGCASSCALIWLAAPIRGGVDVKIHRPYFEHSEFQNLPDAMALQKYNEATSQVKSLLQSRGYSPEFIGSLFRIPREQARALTLKEIYALPIDSALDELVSARCYAGNEQKLGEYSALTDEIRELEKAENQLRSELPDRTDYELQKDPLYAKDYAKLEEMRSREKALRASAANLKGIEDEFIGCKRKERIQVSLKKSGQRLTDEQRAKLKELRELLGWWKRGAPASEIIAKALPNHEMGQRAAQELKTSEERLAAIGAELRRELPAAHIEYLAAAAD